MFGRENAVEFYRTSAVEYLLSDRSLRNLVRHMEHISTIDPSRLRDSYHSILELGMENLQRYRLPERFEYLAIEIDHLHNLPHYMHESNIYVHAYYYCTTRPFYIERLAMIPIINTDSLISQYTEHWHTIRAGLLPFADSINAKHYTERL